MKIAVYAFDGITMFHLAAPLVVFETASSLGLAPEWRTVVWTTDGRSIRTSEGVVLDDLAGPATTADADLLVFPSSPPSFPLPFPVRGTRSSCFRSTPSPPSSMPF